MSTGPFDVAPEVITHLAAFSSDSAFPQALRLARCQSMQLSQQHNPRLPAEGSVLNRGVLRGELNILALNAKVASKLEDLFSWR